MSEKYAWVRIHKAEDHYEREITEDVDQHVCDWFGVEDISELTAEQIAEIEVFREDLNEYSVMQIGYSNIISNWESMQDEL